MNLVMTGAGKFVEIQGTAEGNPFSKEALDKMIALGQKGIQELLARQKKALEE
jgi:ribonuclease PH